MSPRKHGYAAAAAVGKKSTASPPGSVAGATGRFVKRSITVRPDIDIALREIAGDREYSQVANEAFILYVQARGIDAIVKDVEATTGPITDAEKAEADRRLADARLRAEQRRKARR
jgi:hypothetical protein